MMKINVDKIINSSCSLGEGLFLDNNSASWVDINQNKIYFFLNERLNIFKTVSKPSIIFEINIPHITFGSDSGISMLDISTGKEKLINSCNGLHSIENYRSNDGGICGAHWFLSYMHRTTAEYTKGYIYRVSNHSFSLIDDNLKIPNSFIEIDSHKILISDSINSCIWLFQFDNSGNLIQKSIWAKLQPNEIPDGGCIVGDYILIALWDGAAIAVFNKEGTLINKLHVPLKRPTNCKYDEINSKLWVTSAKEGLSNEDISLYPSSGDTIIFSLES